MTAPTIAAPHNQALYPRALPFVLFMLFIGLSEGLEVLGRRGLFELGPTTLYYLYPIKACAVAALLYFYRQHYRELFWRDLANVRNSALSVVVALITCTIWVWTDWVFAVSGSPAGFNPELLPDGAIRILMTAVRVAGAVLVVPLMEELFWRSFMLRYLIDADFEKVPIGRFSWFSFAATTVLFGLEHHFIIAGMIAGAIYNALYYATRSISQCVLAHAVTNLALAVYVLSTGRWYFW
ncbi:CAAX prenyl protease-related protein [Geomonas limicola]|uniref:CAAX prenyl protease-related protein n=1 Tax=Geomonas limicola TaxID=2740186 RepID=A0A6V8N4N1_9BACT|nr:CAAX prenyl protease-related protein [Geomonas limicola]GFO66573.1 CAAX prenyl protease-related protein [Geomonas limicola]